MKKIGIDARFMLRPLRGIPLYVLRLCENLPYNTGYQFKYFVNMGFEHNDKPENYLPRMESIARLHENVEFINYNDDAEIYWEQVFLPYLVKKHGIDLLHMPANRFCFLSKVPTIVTVHDIMEYLFLKMRYAENVKKNGQNLKMLLYITRIAIYALITYKIGLRKTSKIITVSQYSANDIAKTLKIDIKHIKVIHHGLDKEFLTMNETPLETISLKKRHYVLMLGGESYQKNPEGAISAWAKVSSELRKKYPLKIIGFCGGYNSPIMNLLTRFNLTNEVEVKGWVTQEELIEYMRNAAVFLYLSRYEGFGFPLIQAMATGTPIISSNKSSIPEILGPVGLQYHPNDYNGVSSGIIQLLSNHYLWKQQSRKGKEYCQKFTWKNSANSHLALYNELL
jgi:glycosyltransferase involved in cell wall biosynthesis